MKYWTLLWAGIWRKRARTILTMLAVVMAFLLFGLLQGVNAAFATAVDNSAARRLITQSRWGFFEIPYAYKSQIESVPGVKRAFEMISFGGYYQDPKNAIDSFAISPDMLSSDSGIRISNDGLAAMRRTRTGIIVSAAVAKKYAWKVGDRIPLNSALHANADGSHAWQFDIVGTMESSRSTQLSGSIYMNYDYVTEASPQLMGKVHFFYVSIRDPKKAEQISAKIDALFANSNYETHTQTEKEFIRNVIKQFANIGLLVNSIVGAVFFTLLVLTGNTMMQSQRERTSEIGVLKTLGFADRTILWLVLCESGLLCIVAAMVGLGLAALVFPAAGKLLGSAFLSPSVILLGLLMALLLAFVSGMPPAWRALRLRLIDALVTR